MPLILKIYLKSLVQLPKPQKVLQAEKITINLHPVMRQITDNLIKFLPAMRRIVLVAHISHTRVKHKDPLRDIKTNRNL